MTESTTPTTVRWRLAAPDRHRPKGSVAEPLSPFARHRPASAIREWPAARAADLQPIRRGTWRTPGCTSCAARRPGGRPLADVLAPALDDGGRRVPAAQKRGATTRSSRARRCAPAVLRRGRAVHPQRPPRPRRGARAPTASTWARTTRPSAGAGDGRVRADHRAVHTFGGAGRCAHASGIDYFAVGPVHATPTKEGRPAIGLEPVRQAARTARSRGSPSAGSTTHTCTAVLEAGARRIVVVRAIAEARDPGERPREGLREGARWGAAA